MPQDPALFRDLICLLVQEAGGHMLITRDRLVKMRGGTLLSRITENGDVQLKTAPDGKAN